MLMIPEEALGALYLQKANTNRINDRAGELCGISWLYECTELNSDFFIIIERTFEFDLYTIDLWDAVKNKYHKHIACYEDVLDALAEINYTPALVERRKRIIDNVLEDLP